MKCGEIDLGAQGADLGLHDPGAGAVELGQLQLYGGPAGHLGRGPHQDGRLPRAVGDERAEDTVLPGERGDHRPAQRAGRVGAAGVHGAAAAGLQGLGGLFGHVRAVVVLARPVPGEDGAPVGEAERFGAEQRAEGAGRLAGGLLGEPGAQRRRGERGGVQGEEGGPFDGGAEIGVGDPAAAPGGEAAEHEAHREEHGPGGGRRGEGDAAHRRAS